MSACNIFLSRQAVTLWTDGAAYDGDQVFQFACAKVVPLPHLRSAIVVRGPWNALGPVLNQANRCASFDELAADLADIVRSIATAHRDDFLLFDPEADTLFEVFAAGWGDAGPAVYRCRSDEEAATTAGKAVITPGDQALMDRIRAEFPTMADDDIHRPKIARRLMALQRERACSREVDEHGGRWAVGGFLQLTTITRTAITSEILQRWPDQPDHHLGVFG